jgi:hypothetical protein
MAGIAAGLFDFAFNAYKAVTAGTSVLRPWKGVAAALLGKDAIMRGGDAMAFAGIGLHFVITIGAAAVYYVVARRQGWLVRRPWISGLVFGILFFLAMNYVIVPLSLIGRPIYVGAETIGYALLGHVVMIGLPIALITSWRLKSVTSIPAP